MSYIYSIIRKDIPLADQIVQTAHSAFHAGNESNPLNGKVPSLILLEVKNKEELMKLRDKIWANNIQFYDFFEPDDGMGYTSITTAPVTDEQRKLFSNMRLWRAA
jgi:hypothetical protein